MTQKERFRNVLQFRPVDRAPLMEIAVWGQTRERWLHEGMPASCNTGFMHRGDAWFGLEGYETVDLNVTGPIPAVESRVLEENAETVLFVDGMGRTRRALKTGTVGGTRLSMDTYLEFPVRDRASFAAFKWRYEGPVAERYPPDWEAVKAAALASERPLTLMNPLGGTFGYYSMLRNWMGTEALSYLWYDDPALIHACLDFLTDFALRTLERALREIPFDFVYIHEDMAGKGGPLMGPKLFREFLLPHYKRLVGFLTGHGLPLVLVDTDGDHEVLIPLFLEAGVNGFGPIERAAGMDPLDLRRRYGSAFCMLGGVDKREIGKDRAAIDREVEQFIRPLVGAGGFIPMIDHAVPPDVSLANFRYYLERKRNAILG